MALPSPTQDELDGLSLYGEGLDAAGAAEWLANEAEAYFAIAGGGGESRTASLTRHHALRHLAARRFARALALGPGGGGDFRALAPMVGGFVAIEPARGFWRETLAGVPAEFRLPRPDGKLDLADGSIDLAAGFGVLHHIPNVSQVLREVARVLKPGAPLILREPIGWLGDFRRPRPGLTRHERGIPHPLMDRMLAEVGLALRRKSFASFPGPREATMRLGPAYPWDSPAVVRLDALLAWLARWNIRYRREKLWHKIAPRMCYWLAEKR